MSPINTPCWEWPGTRDRNGYGKAGHRMVHRMSFEAAIGPVPEGHLVLHTCDNPPCFRPDHLFAGSQQDNVADRDAKGRRGASRGTGRTLDPAKVRAIRASDLTYRQLAETYGVSHSTISKIRAGLRWIEGQYNMTAGV